MENNIKTPKSTDTRQMFTAVFSKYEYGDKPVGNRTVFSDIRSREGGIVKRHVVFDEEISGTIPKELSIGEYVSFLADVEFRNVQFVNVWDLGVSL